MGRYELLESYLARRGGEEIELGFEEVERIIGDPLPASAGRPHWWSEEAAADERADGEAAWRKAGYEAFLLPRERVLFRRRADND